MKLLAPLTLSVLYLSNFGEAKKCRTSTTNVNSPTTPTADAVSSIVASPSAVASPTTSDVAPSPSATVTSSSSLTPGGKKKGVAWYGPTGAPPAALNSAISWYYNWDSTATTGFSGNIYVPMLWGSDTAKTTAFAAATCGTAPQYVLGFNEPEQSDQSNLTVEQAVPLWNQYIAPLKAKGTKLGSPGMAWSTSWLAQFDGNTTAASDDFIAWHVYQTSVAAVQGQVKQMYAANGGKKIWLTEFACLGFGPTTYCTADETTAFMKEIVPWLEASDMIAAYSWEPFNTGDNNKILNADGTLNDLGKLYVSL